MVRNKEVMLTVKMLAYNHEKYISQAIESILTQKTVYPYELLIGEDCSTDTTRSIVRSYEEKYPEKIRVIYQNINQGCTMNSYSLDLEARGKYIAGCEGDDYWCDETRIQRDVDFLERHPEYVGVCHKCKIVDDDGTAINEDNLGERARFWKFDKDVFTINDFVKWKTPGHGCAQTRRNVIRENSDIDYSIIYKASKRVSDRSHLLVHIVEGDIYCMQDIVACYRYRLFGSQQNYMAIQKQCNLKAEDYKMIKCIEEWAWNNKNIKLDLSAVKKDRLVGATVVWMKNPSKENAKVIKDIIEASDDTLRYCYWVLKIIINKLFYWKILKRDRLIKL